MKLKNKGTFLILLFSIFTTLLKSEVVIFIKNSSRHLVISYYDTSLNFSKLEYFKNVNDTLTLNTGLFNIITLVNFKNTSIDNQTIYIEDKDTIEISASKAILNIKFVNKKSEFKNKEIEIELKYFKNLKIIDFQKFEYDYNVFIKEWKLTLNDSKYEKYYLEKLKLLENKFLAIKIQKIKLENKEYFSILTSILKDTENFRAAYLNMYYKINENKYNYQKIKLLSFLRKSTFRDEIILSHFKSLSKVFQIDTNLNKTDFFIDENFEKYISLITTNKNFEKIKVLNTKNENIFLESIVSNKDTSYLIEFWASWCGPCIKNLDHLKLISKNMDSKIKIILISIDESNSQWKNAIKRNQLNQFDNFLLNNTKFNFFGKKVFVDKIPFNIIKNNLSIKINEVNLMKLSSFRNINNK